jgi:hypothetical protein
MNDNIVKKAGRREAIKFATLGLLLAAITFYSLCLLDGGFFLGFFLIWGSQNIFFSIDRFIIILIIAIYFISYYLGQIVAKEILIKHKNYILTGFKYGLYTITLATFITSGIEYLIIGVSNIGTRNLFINFDLLRILAVTIFLGLPSMLLTSFLFARQLKKRAKE